MDHAHEEFNEDRHPTVLHAAYGQTICGEVLRAGGKEIDGWSSSPAGTYRDQRGKAMFPEINAKDLGEKLKSDEKFILLDVRELEELDYAKIEDDRLEVVPMSKLADEGTDALPESVRSQDLPVYIICHHGTRSAQVTAWL